MCFSQFRSWRASTSLCASTITKAAAFRCAVLTLARTVSLPPKALMTFHSTLLLTRWKAPRHSKDHTTRPGSLLGARVPVLQAYRPTRAIRQIVAVEATTPPRPVHPQAFNIILTSVSFFQFPYLINDDVACQNQIARIHTRILSMSRVERHFSRAPRHRMQITLLRSALNLTYFKVMRHSFHSAHSFFIVGRKDKSQSFFCTMASVTHRIGQIRNGAYSEA